MNKSTIFKILFSIIILIVASQFLIAQSVQEKFLKVKELEGIEEYQYEPNGMNVLLVQDNSAPVVTVQIVYRVGSKHEVSGNTGSTHLLEHLMFKGTEKFNKQKGTSIDGKLNNIGARMNATTWNDRTNYFETIPSDKIAIALEIEADRMRNSLLLKEDKESEMTVVRNEFERSENNPDQVLSKEIWATAYMAHTYHHSTIGWRSDIEKMPIEVLREFYNTYYWPDNATLTIIGDFQKEQLFTLVDKYFGKISKAPHVMPQPYTEEPVQYGPRKVIMKKSGQGGVIAVGYKIPGALHKDVPALKVLGEIIGKGTSSLLNKEFIDKGLAYYAYTNVSKFADVGLFIVGLGTPPTADFETLNQQLLTTIEQLKTAGVQQTEVDRIVAKLNTQTILSRDGSGRIAGQLTEAIATGDWTEYINSSKKLSRVTAEDVKRVANQYLVEDQSTTGHFIPKMMGNNEEVTQKTSNFKEIETAGKNYYRNPLVKNKIKNIKKLTPVSIQNELAPVDEKSIAKATGIFNRKKINGIDIITSKTGAKDFVMVAASIPIGSYLNTQGNELIPTLTAQMLSKGTAKMDKFQFSEELEKLGVQLNVRARAFKIDIRFKCLKKDIPTVINLLAEELRYPLFDVKEFEIIKKQLMGRMKRGLANPSTMGNITLTQAIYPKGHPNYITSIDNSLEELEQASLDEVRAFHEKYFGPAGIHLVAIGDVDTKALHRAIEQSFQNWTGGISATVTYDTPDKPMATTKVISIPQKPSAELYIGQYTGIKRSDPDYIPFYIGNFAFGGGFSGRLMRTVRDEEGLTYNIGTRHEGHIYTGGHWYINASFNPSLFQKGLDATMVQLKKWVNNGITDAELAAKKNNLVGSFKVGMSTTSGMAGTILGFVERGQGPEYIYQYPKDIEATTLNQVNSAIQKFIDLDKLVIIKSGSLDQYGKPLK